MTMQKAVGIPSENEDEEESWHVGKLEDDFIIADEFGMCDMYLADRFFSAIKKDATLVMIGDKDQLGSVGPGNVFHEMIVSGMIPTTILDSAFVKRKEVRSWKMRYESIKSRRNSFMMILLNFILLILRKMHLKLYGICMKNTGNQKENGQMRYRFCHL